MPAVGISTNFTTRPDFPPTITPYSATESNQRSGSLTFAVVDLGVNLINSSDLRVGPFIGYSHLNEELNAYGCTQVASNPNVCSAVSSTSLNITEDAGWSMGRLGLAGEIQLWEGLKLSGNAAWLPFGSLGGTDTHWLRIDVGGPTGLSGPIVQTGPAQGAQLQVLIKHNISAVFDIGVGGQYMSVYSNGISHFELAETGGTSQPTKFSTTRYGVFVRASVSF